MKYTIDDVITDLLDNETFNVLDRSNGRVLFNTATKACLPQQLSAYCAGLMTGVEIGKAQLQEEIRQVLGVGQ